MRSLIFFTTSCGTTFSTGHRHASYGNAQQERSHRRTSAGMIWNDAPGTTTQVEGWRAGLMSALLGETTRQANVVTLCSQQVLNDNICTSKFHPIWYGCDD